MYVTLAYYHILFIVFVYVFRCLCTQPYSNPHSRHTRHHRLKNEMATFFDSSFSSCGAEIHASPAKIVCRTAIDGLFLVPFAVLVLKLRIKVFSNFSICEANKCACMSVLLQVLAQFNLRSPRSTQQNKKREKERKKNEKQFVYAGKVKWIWARDFALFFSPSFCLRTRLDGIANWPACMS